jgi:integrase
MNVVEPIRDHETIKRLRNFLKKQSVRNELLFILGINVGLRIGDILKLTIGDLVKHNGIPRDYVVIKEEKTAKTKKFYVGSIVKEVILNMLATMPELHRDEFLFKSRKGCNHPISRQQAYRILNRAAEALGLVERDPQGRIANGEIGTHTLRKTFGYHAYQSGVSLELLMEIFNHASKTQTLRYIGITEEQKKEVYLQSNLG